MTSLIAWIAVDSRGPSSAYFASDSRITWSGKQPWDHGRKLFASSKYPHILGYCGNVLFPTQILGQIIDMIDANLLVDLGDNIDTCVHKIMSVVSNAYQTYHEPESQGFEILYCMREGQGMSSKFHIRKIKFEPPTSSYISRIDLPAQSDVVTILGSGTPSIDAALRRWKSSDVGGTSRAIFSAFCDSLRSCADQLSGGPPQLVGLFRIQSARAFGIIKEGRRHFYGLEANETSRLDDIRWYNELLEICDPHTFAVKSGAQRQPRPRGL